MGQADGIIGAAWKVARGAGLLLILAAVAYVIKAIADWDGRTYTGVGDEEEPGIDLDDDGCFW